MRESAEHRKFVQAGSAAGGPIRVGRAAKTATGWIEWRWPAVATAPGVSLPRIGVHRFGFEDHIAMRHALIATPLS